MSFRIYFFLGIALLFLQSCNSDSQGNEFTDLDVHMIHQKTLTLDTHVDTPYSWFFREGFDFAGNDESLGFNNQVDLDKMKKGELDAIFLVAFIPQGPLDDDGGLMYS